MPTAATPPARRTPHSTPAGWKSRPDGQHSEDQQQKQSARTSREVYEMAPKGPSSLLMFLSPHTGHRLEGTEILTPDCHLSMEADGGFGGGTQVLPIFTAAMPQCTAMHSRSTRPSPATVECRTAAYLHQQPSSATFISNLHAGLPLCFNPGSTITVGNPQETK